jgi:hypothetical protein
MVVVLSIAMARLILEAVAGLDSSAALVTAVLAL